MYVCLPRRWRPRCRRCRRRSGNCWSPAGSTGVRRAGERGFWLRCAGNRRLHPPGISRRGEPVRPFLPESGSDTGTSLRTRTDVILRSLASEGKAYNTIKPTWRGYSTGKWSAGWGIPSRQHTPTGLSSAWNKTAPGWPGTGPPSPDHAGDTAPTAGGVGESRRHMGRPNAVGGELLWLLWLHEVGGVYGGWRIRPVASSLAGGYFGGFLKFPFVGMRSPKAIEDGSIPARGGRVFETHGLGLMPGGSASVVPGASRLGSGLPFRHRDGRPLSKTTLVLRICQALTSQGVRAGSFSGHSFRIGAASTAAARGLEDSTIRTLGRWKSDAYQRYIRLRPEEIAAFSQNLCT